MTSARERKELTEIARLVAEEAAMLVSAGYRSGVRSTEKAVKDLVTEFDRASEELLRSRLASLAGPIPFIGEESASAEDLASAPGGLAWYVDPLDGTTNFVHGHPFWCVSVGLLEDGLPVAGAVVAPAVSLRWSGFEGGGAQRNGEPCAVSATERLDASLVATGFPPIRDEAPANNFDSFMRVKRQAQAVRRCGSAAMDLCLVADGTYDGYWERRLHAWDAAAGAALVLAAGGKLTSLEGGQADLLRGHIAASNGLIHGDLVRAVVG